MSYTLKDIEKDLPALPEGYEWQVSTYLADVYDIRWSIDIVRVEPRGWIGLFTKRTTVRSGSLSSNVIPVDGLNTLGRIMHASLIRQLTTEGGAGTL